MANLTALLRRYGPLLLAVILLVAPSITTQYEFYVVERGVQNAIHVLGLLILTGYGGMLSLGSAGLLATGAYAYAVLITKLPLSPWLGAALAVAFTTLVGAGLAVPSFRLSGPFLTVTTVGFGEIVRILALNLQALTGGAYGISGYAPLLSSQRWVYYLMVVCLALVAVGVQRIEKSQLGLALKAIREDEVAAEAMGVHVKRVKMLAFVLSAMLAGLSGVFLANLTGYLSPDCFTSAESSAYLLMVVMSGMQSTVGAILCSLLLTSLPEVLRFMANSRLLVYSLVLLVYLRVKWVKGRRSRSGRQRKTLTLGVGAGGAEGRG